MVFPAITDVTMAALCPGKDECSLAIYLSGFQQAMIGLGTLVMMPVIGNLSDQYGRKALLTLPLTLSIIPLAIMAYSRTTSFFYAYFLLRTLTAMVCEGSVNCLALAYVADTVPEGQRAAAFGVLSGICSSSFVFGTLVTRFISTTATFQVATLVSMLAAIYMRVFLKESVPIDDSLSQPIIIKGDPDLNVDQNDDHGDQPLKKISSISVYKNIPSIEDLTCLLKSSTTFSQAAVVAFFNSLAEGGMQAASLYFLKARFHFNKDQFADLMLISGIAATVSQASTGIPNFRDFVSFNVHNDKLLFMPLLTPIIGEKKLLSIGLLVGCVNTFLYSISWAIWVPYALSVFTVLAFFAIPALRSIASKQVGSNEQGKAQGCISGISSFANIISPLIFSPLTALFLSDRAPFNFPGFSIMGIGLATMIAFIQSLLIRDISSDSKSQNQYSLVA
ncbi:hypothetical protein JRO89_XS02G0010300 [Xanthoceras sorbifolium]|uniref:Major facilitator superfamily (MFS) profile domain-containing protein n=1 Tax=Xanthoceras sorbifolium TaxID=99658 RepID=A0ABQ8IDW7_9ROSI|nr:hypothetical protein JRO89_XS02G0010300 [Xanthoceras sorbifolium]